MSGDSYRGSEPQKFNPPYRYEYTEHGPVTIHDAVNVGWIARVKESLPYKRELAEVIVDALNREARRRPVTDAFVSLLAERDIAKVWRYIGNECRDPDCPYCPRARELQVELVLEESE